ncbi:MAG: UbiA family prenyltransferase, partial [Bacteroidetes bacterium]|nr:UbiA family prenyltransferase [Bacteroidota bacterium]
MQWIKSLDYFFILRPIVFFPGWTTALAAYAVSGAAQAPALFPDHPLSLVLLSTGMLMGCGFIVNQLADTESDRINKKLFLLSEGFISRRNARIEAILMAAGGLAITYYTSSTLFLIVISGLVLIPAYSIPPFRLKDHAFRSLLANATMGGLAFIYGWFIRGPVSSSAVYALIPYLCYNTAMYLLTTIPDVEGDRKTNKHTLAVKYGVPATLRIALGLISLSLIDAVWLRDWIIAVPSAVALPLIFIAYQKNTIPRSITALKYSLFVFALTVSYFFPWYLLIIALFFIITKFYYRKRFNLDYPNFKGQ